MLNILLLAFCFYLAGFILAALLIKGVNIFAQGRTYEQLQFECAFLSVLFLPFGTLLIAVLAIGWIYDTLKSEDSKIGAFYQRIKRWIEK